MLSKKLKATFLKTTRYVPGLKYFSSLGFTTCPKISQLSPFGQDGQQSPEGQNERFNARFFEIFWLDLTFHISISL